MRGWPSLFIKIEMKKYPEELVNVFDTLLLPCGGNKATGLKQTSKYYLNKLFIYGK
jgi:hypothetical protein